MASVVACACTARGFRPAISGLECFWGVALTELDAAHVAWALPSADLAGVVTRHAMFHEHRSGRLPYVLFIWNYLRLLDAWESLSLSSQFVLPVVAAWHVLEGRLRGGFSVELSSVVAHLHLGQASREPLDLEPGKPLRSAGTQQLDSTWGHLKLWRSSVGRVKNLISQKANPKI